MSDTVRFSEAVSRSLHHEVADQIGMRIVSGEIAPGEPLPSEARLCEMMKVSRTALREAIRMLAGKGLLESRPRSGTRVRPAEHWNHLDAEVLRWRFEATGTETYLRKLFELRFIFEPAAAALAAAHADEAQISRIRQAHTEMAQAASSLQAFAEADIEFHRAIYLAGNNEFFFPMIQMLSIALRPSFEIAATGDHRARAIAEHGALLEAIAAHDPSAARAAALVLLDHSETDLVKILGHAGQAAEAVLTAARPSR